MLQERADLLPTSEEEGRAGRPRDLDADAEFLRPVAAQAPPAPPAAPAGPS